MSHPLLSRLATHTCLAVIFVGCGGQGSPTVDDGPVVATTGEALTLQEHITGIGATFDSHGNLSEDGKTYVAVYKPTDPVSRLPPAWVHLPWLSPSQIDPATGYHGIGFTVNPSGDATGLDNPLNDKANLLLKIYSIKSATGGPVDMWEGFKIKFSDQFFAQPNVDLTLAQWWQGLAGSPPVTLVETAKSPTAAGFACDVLVRNNQTGGNPSAKVNHIPLGTCKKDGLWHPFLIHIRADWSGNGLVEVWLDGLPKGSYSGNVGYQPGKCVTINGGPTCLNSEVAKPTLSAFYGLYRPRDTVAEQVFYSNIKFAYDRQSADPMTP
jgi:Polysaccharide lyase